MLIKRFEATYSLEIIHPSTFFYILFLAHDNQLCYGYQNRCFYIHNVRDQISDYVYNC